LISVVFIGRSSLPPLVLNDSEDSLANAALSEAFGRLLFNLGAIILATIFAPACGISSKAILIAHVNGTANTAPAAPHTEYQKTKHNNTVTSERSNPFLYATGPTKSPTIADAKDGKIHAHHLALDVNSGNNNAIGTGNANEIKDPTVGMKYNQNERIANEAAKINGTPQKYKTQLTKAALKSAKTIMMFMNLRTATTVRFTTGFLNLNGCLSGTNKNIEYTPHKHTSPKYLNTVVPTCVQKSSSFNHDSTSSTIVCHASTAT
jgi:hypothetical protein|tara:strand:+ start:4179 stop:4967 length:789 start_codon:yes stop_codon:yes gene_type:complete